MRLTFARQVILSGNKRGGWQSAKTAHLPLSKRLEVKRPAGTVYAGVWKCGANVLTITGSPEWIAKVTVFGVTPAQKQKEKRERERGG